jgi:hypothetical protein
MKTLKNISEQVKADLAAGRTAETAAGVNRLVDELAKYRLEFKKDG